VSPATRTTPAPASGLRVAGPLSAPRLPRVTPEPAKAPPLANPRRNPHADAARERKVAYLVLEAVALAKRVGCSLAELVAAMERWGDLEWNQLAVDAGQKPPNTSKPEVLRLLRMRAAKESPPPAVRFVVCQRPQPGFAYKTESEPFDTRAEAEAVLARQRELGITSGSGFAAELWIEEWRASR
jgi:hypothetical protein